VQAERPAAWQSAPAVVTTPRRAISTCFTRRELRELTGWSEHQVRVGLGRLVALEYVAEQRRPGRRHSYVVADDEHAGPRDGPREVREPSSRGQLPALPGPIADLATFAPTRSGRALHVGKHVGKEDVDEDPILEAQR
jgi:hypothetical protein